MLTEVLFRRIYFRFSYKVLSTPFYGDQFVNSAFLKKRGMAETLFYEDLSDTDKVYDALLNLLQPRFVSNK